MSDCSVALRAVTPMNSAAATRMRAAGSARVSAPLRPYRHKFHNIWISIL